MLTFLCIAGVLLGSSQAFTHRDANEYLDGVLEGRFVEEAKYSRLDPYRLQNFDTGLNFTARPSGRATLSKIAILNLSKVRRTRDCTVPSWQSANISFTCFLEFDNLKVNYTANVTYGNVVVTFYPHVIFKNVNVTAQITTAKEEDLPNLKLFFVSHVGDMSVTAKMISIGDTAQIVGPAIRNVLTKHSMKSLHEALRGRFRDALAFSVYKTPIGFLID